MSINSPEEYVKNLWDWRILDGCFGDSKISVSDIDGFVERNGKILILETKAPGVKIPTGQNIAFNSFVRQGITVFLIWGYPGNPERMSIWPRNSTPCNLDIVRNFVKRWFYWADTGQKMEEQLCDVPIAETT